MTTPTSQRPLDSFESALLSELRDVVATRTPTDIPHRTLRRPALRWAGVAAAAAVVATALQLGPGRGASPAYAVTDDPDGAVIVTVSRLEDGSGLQEALQAKGINARVDYVPDGKMCDPTRLTEAALSSGRGLISVQMDAHGTTFTIPRGLLGATETLVLEAMVTADPGNTIGMRATIAQGPVGACALVASDVPGLGAPPDRNAPGPGQGSAGSDSTSSGSISRA